MNRTTVTLPPGKYRVEMLGGLRVLRDGKELEPFPTRMVGELFAYLAYHIHRRASRELLVEKFWPERDEMHQRNSLSHALSTLRTRLEPPGVLSGSVIVADRQFVGLSPEAIVTDVREFEEALKCDHTVEHIERLETGLSLYQGDLLPEFYEEWIPPQQERLKKLCLEGLRSLVQLHSQRGDPSRALEYALRAVSIDQTREESQRDLIQLFGDTGQYSAALQQYRELETILAREFNQPPSAATRKLIAVIETRAKSEPTVQSPIRGHVPKPPLPAGVVTFLVTDIVHSTQKWEQFGTRFQESLDLHHQLMRSQFEAFGGHPFKESGDGFFVVFASAEKAAQCGIQCQMALHEANWPQHVGSIQCRMALHTGEATPNQGDYHGRTVTRSARLATAAHGGQIICSGITAEILRPVFGPDCTLRRLGRFQVRDIQEPTELYQIEHPGLTHREFPPLNADPEYRGDYPTALNRFFGRVSELDHLEERLRATDSRLITVIGMGGAGKTRLAQELALKMAESFRDAIWFVTLAEITDSERIPDAIARTMHINPSPDQTPLEQVGEALKRQPSLLILDNYEHLVETGATMVNQLLNAAPTLKVLATSRQPLSLKLEEEIPLLPMPVPGGTTDVDAIRDCISVQLLVNRARLVRPTFSVTETNAQDVAALCNRLEGLPLSIELAAARLALLSPEQMLRELQDRFLLLTSHKRDVLPHQRTLYATLDWSFQLLPAELRTMLAQLSVFRGGWTVGAAEVVCSNPLALDDLAMLRDNSLIYTEEGDGQIRFKMLETVREFALLEASPKEQETTRKRHLNFFKTYAVAWEASYTQPNQDIGTMPLDSERDNLLTAMNWGLPKPEHRETALRLANALYPWWRVQGRYREGREALAWVELEDVEIPDGVRAHAFTRGGALAVFLGDYGPARDKLKRGVDLFVQLDDVVGEIAVLKSLCGLEHRQRNFNEAKAYAERLMSRSHDQGDLIGEADANVWMGMIAEDMQDHVLAERYFLASVGQYQLSRAAAKIAPVLNNLGYVARNQGNPIQAVDYYKRSLELQERDNDQASIARTLNNLGDAYRAAGKYDISLKTINESINIWRRLENSEELAKTLVTLATAQIKAHLLENARESLRESGQIYQRIRSQEGLCYVFACLAELSTVMGDHESAARLLATAEHGRKMLPNALPASDRDDWDATLASIHKALPPARFEAAWRIGCTMPLFVE